MCIVFVGISTINTGGRVITGTSLLGKSGHYLNNNMNPSNSHNVSILPAKARPDQMSTKTIVVVPVTANMIISNMDLKKTQPQMNSAKRMRTQ